MKNRKGIILIVMVLSFSLFATGCMKKVNEKIGTKIGEKILEKALGDDVKIDTKDNSMSIESKDGSYKVGENIDWPGDKMNPLPEPNAKVISVSEQEDDESTIVMVHFPSKKESLDYYEQVKTLGFVEGSVTESEGYFSYMGYGTDNSQVVVSSQGLDDELTLGIITMIKDSDYAKEFFKKVEEGEPVQDLTGEDLTDEVPWPKSDMGKVPELPGKIIDVIKSRDEINIEFEFVKKEDVFTFIEAIKKLGFDANASEVISPDNILYMSRNKEDHSLSIRWFGTGAKINYTRH